MERWTAWKCSTKKHSSTQDIENLEPLKAFSLAVLPIIEDISAGLDSLNAWSVLVPFFPLKTKPSGINQLGRCIRDQRILPKMLLEGSAVPSSTSVSLRDRTAPDQFFVNKKRQT